MQLHLHKSPSPFRLGLVDWYNLGILSHRFPDGVGRVGWFDSTADPFCFNNYSTKIPIISCLLPRRGIKPQMVAWEASALPLGTSDG
jgi:hypothetical protein